MDRCRAPAAVRPDHGDDPDELGVFAAERYFYGDDALWCDRSSSSLSSAFRTAGTLDHDHDRSVVPTTTAATSSSEASWNSRSALLPIIDPPPPPAEKSRAAAATPAAGAVPASGAESERAGHGHNRRASSSNLRRWLLGVAGCACAARGHGEESASDEDEMEAGSDGVPGAGGKKWNNGDSEMFLKGAQIQEITAVTVRPGSGRWLLAGREAAFSAVEIAAHGHRRGANSVELPRPILHPDRDERRRVKSLEKSRPPLRDVGSDFGLATQSSAFTIVAGNAAPTPTSGGGESPGDGEDDDAAPSELGCAYPPSEASVVWSVVTADDGAASGVFSSAASGYYHHHYFDYGGEDSASRHAAAAKSDRRRRSGGITTASSSLLTCMSQKAVDAVGPAAQSVHRPEAEPAAVARLRAAAGNRNGHGGGHQDVVRRRVGR